MTRTGTQMAPARAFRSLLGTDPFRELFDLQRNINRLFGEVSGEDVSLKAWAPAVDIYEDENAFLVKCELPEVSKEDVKVSLNDNVLSISGERRMEHEDRRDGYHRVERSYGQFYRSFTLPPNVDVDGINAEFKDGVLRLTVPKKEEAKPRQIRVNVG